MSDELEFLRGFRGQDGVVDAGSAHEARVRLLAHIEQAGSSGGRRVGRLGGYRRAVQASSRLVALGVVVGVMVAVGVVFLSLHGHPPSHRAPASIHHRSGPAVLANVAPRSLPKVPGQFFCNADLAAPGVTPGLGGRRSAVINVHTATIRGVARAPFSITARGLAPSGRTHRYAVWAIQVSGSGSEAVPVAGARYRLLGVVTPGVGEDGRLAAVGVLPVGTSGTYLIRITLQPPGSDARPGRTLLEGVGQL